MFTASAVALSVVTPVVSANGGFSDFTAANSHFDAVQSLVKRGVLNGYEDGTFKTNAPFTRGQVAKKLTIRRHERCFNSVSCLFL